MSEKSNRKCKHEFQINIEFLKKLIALSKGKTLVFNTLKTQITFQTIFTEEDEKQLIAWLNARKITNAIRYRKEIT